MVVLVTSAMPSEGKSTTALGLAVAAANGDRQVVLVECDLRRPVLGERLGLERQPGLLDVLADGAPLEAALRPLPGSDEGYVLLAGGIARHPAEAVGSGRMRDLVRTLSDRFDTVVLDAPPLLVAADAGVLSRMADVVALATLYGHSRDTEQLSAGDALRRVDGLPTAMLTLGVARRSEDEHLQPVFLSSGGRRSERREEVAA